MINIQRRFSWIWLLLVAGFFIGCTASSTPPGASSIGGVVDGGSYSYHYWEEGLAVLFWQDVSYGSGEGCSGTGSTDDPVYRLECDVSGPEGRNYSWRVHSTDGLTGEMWIEDQPIDLSKGAMFLVNVGEDGPHVEQLQRDLSTLERSNEAIAALAQTDPDVANFLAGSGAEGDLVDAGDQYGLAEFTEALRAGGQSVEIGGQVDQPFFSVPGQIVAVNGQDVQVFEYPDPAAAAGEAAQISPDASSVGTSMMTWVATPHFYARDRVILLYVGDDESVVDALTQELGQPVAQGQGMVQLPVETVTRLSDAFEAADYESLQGLMGETFAIGYWLSEGQRLTPAEAMEQLRLNLLPNPPAVSFIRDRAQFPDLGDVDPIAVFGPDVEIVDLVYSQGWGPEGLDEAILAIAQNADGSQYWHGILTGRFDVLPEPPAQEPASNETAVYHNAENGFELDYPASWRLDEQVLGSRASGASFYGEESDEEPVFSAVVYLWDPKNDLDAWVDQRRLSWSGSDAAVLLEEELTVADGQQAIQFELQWPGGQTTNHLFMVVGDRYLELVSSGDADTFGAIIGSLRLVGPDS